MGRERSDFVVVANRLPVAPVDDASAPGGVSDETETRSPPTRSDTHSRG